MVEQDEERRFKSKELSVVFFKRVYTDAHTRGGEKKTRSGGKR